MELLSVDSFVAKRTKKPQLQEVPVRVERLQRGLGLPFSEQIEGMGVWMLEAGVSSICFSTFNLDARHASAVKF